MLMFKFELGEIVEDIVTGFQGVIVARCEYLFQSDEQYGVQARLGDSRGVKPTPIQWIYSDRLKGIRGIPLFENEEG